MLSENVKVRLSCYLFLSPGPSLSQRTKHPRAASELLEKTPAFLLQLIIQGAQIAFYYMVSGPF